MKSRLLAGFLALLIGAGQAFAVPQSISPPVSAGQVTGLAPSATTDTTNATNITSGTLAATQGGTGSNGGAWTAFTPTFTATGGTGVVFSSNRGAFLQEGRKLTFRAIVAVAFTTAPASLTLTVPNGKTGADSVGLTGVNASGNFALTAQYVSSTNITVAKYDGTSPVATTGQAVIISGTMETTN